MSFSTLSSWISRVGFAFTLGAAGCQNAADSEQIDLQGLVTVAQLRQQLGPNELLRDRPAQINYQRMQEIFAQGREDALALRVYSLEPVPDAVSFLKKRAHELDLDLTFVDPRIGADLPAIDESEPGLGAVSQALTADADDDIVRALDGAWELSINRSSGTERFVNKDLFHSLPGVAKLPLSDDQYRGRALAHLQKKISTALGSSVHPYKTRRYMNATQAIDAKMPEIETYQVAMVFNTDVDGIAVIGSGSKVSIHMSVDGDVLSHETSVRATATSVATVSGSKMHAPNAARQLVERRLAERGIDLRQFQLVDAQFGYFRRGRGNLQEIVAPAYAFFYNPTDEAVAKEQGSKRLVEVVGAIDGDPIAGAIAADDAADRDRKARMQTGTPDPRQ